MTIIEDTIHTLKSLENILHKLEKRRLKKPSRTFKYLPKPTRLLSEFYGTIQVLPKDQKDAAENIIHYFDTLWDLFDVHVKLRERRNPIPKPGF